MKRSTENKPGENEEKKNKSDQISSLNRSWFLVSLVKIRTATSVYHDENNWFRLHFCGLNNEWICPSLNWQWHVVNVTWTQLSVPLNSSVSLFLIMVGSRFKHMEVILWYDSMCWWDVPHCHCWQSNTAFPGNVWHFISCVYSANNIQTGLDELKLKHHVEYKPSYSRKLRSFGLQLPPSDLLLKCWLKSGEVHHVGLKISTCKCEYFHQMLPVSSFYTELSVKPYSHHSLHMVLLFVFGWGRG